VEAIARTLPSDLRFKAIIAAALLVALLAAVAIGRMDSGTSPDGEGAAAVFGLDRASVAITPGVAVSGALAVPQGYAEGAVSYSIRGGSGADQVNVSGQGVEFAFEAPRTGEVQLTARVDGPDGKHTTSTSFVVSPALEFVGTELEYRGEVRVDGSRAITGEALPRGTRLDASNGEVSYVANAAADGSITGRLRFEGSAFAVDATVDGARVKNEVTLTRDREQTSTLDVEVEPVSGKHRYVTVNTPDAVAMVKGTRFTVTVAPEASQVDVEEGLVFAWDRFRYYMAGKDMPVEESLRVEALEFAMAMDSLSDAIHPGGGAFTGGTGAAGSARREAGWLDEQFTSVDELVGKKMAEMPAPAMVNPERMFSDPEGLGAGPVGGGTGADNGNGRGDGVGGSGNGRSDGSSGSDTGSGGDKDGSGGSSGSGTRPIRPGGDGGGARPPRDGGSTGGTTPPNPGPPTREPYTLEQFEAAGFRQCLSTHVLWNGSYDDPSGPHRCVPRAMLRTLFDDTHPYRPLEGFGCFRPHAVWRHVAGAVRFCFPAAQAFVDGLGIYQPPRLFQGAGQPLAALDPACSDAHRLEAGLCRPL